MRIRWRGFELPTAVVCDEATETDRYARFVIEPFERGFGTTIGNSLRRVLLSSLEGAAITSVRFDNVLHEFSTLPGVYEDVADVILNLKQLRVRVVGPGPCIIRINKSGKGDVTGADVICDENSEVANRNLHIATLSEDATLSAEMTVEKGRGYVTAEEREQEERAVGRIPLDAVFSPVVRVRYKAENTRVGQRTNYDRLVLEVWTDGTVTPGMALVEAAKILRRHLNPVVQHSELGGELEQTKAAGKLAGPEGDLPPEVAEKLEWPISELQLSVRAFNCLVNEKIETIGQLMQRSGAELLEARNFGKTSLDEVQQKLQDLDLSLQMGGENQSEEEAEGES